MSYVSNCCDAPVDESRERCLACFEGCAPVEVEDCRLSPLCKCEDCKKESENTWLMDK